MIALGAERLVNVQPLRRRAEAAFLKLLGERFGRRDVFHYTHGEESLAGDRPSSTFRIILNIGGSPKTVAALRFTGSSGGASLHDALVTARKSY